MGDFRKNILRTDIEGKNILQGNTWGKYILHWKKKLSWRIMVEKNLTPLYVGEKILSPEVWKKRFLPKPNHPFRSQSQMVESLHV